MERRWGVYADERAGQSRLLRRAVPKSSVRKDREVDAIKSLRGPDDVLSLSQDPPSLHHRAEQGGEEGGATCSVRVWGGGGVGERGPTKGSIVLKLGHPEALHDGELGALWCCVRCEQAHDDASEPMDWGTETRRSSISALMNIESSPQRNATSVQRASCFLSASRPRGGWPRRSIGIEAPSRYSMSLPSS